MHHSEFDAYQDLERRAGAARCCSTWNPEESARSFARLQSWGFALGLAAGFGAVLLCVLGYAIYRLTA